MSEICAFRGSYGGSAVRPSAMSSANSEQIAEVESKRLPLELAAQALVTSKTRQSYSRISNSRDLRHSLKFSGALKYGAPALAHADLHAGDASNHPR